jgi:hypothetical protein
LRALPPHAVAASRPAPTATHDGISVCILLLYHIVRSSMNCLSFAPQQRSWVESKYIFCMPHCPSRRGTGTHCPRANDLMSGSWAGRDATTARGGRARTPTLYDGDGGQATCRVCFRRQVDVGSGTGGMRHVLVG